MLAYQVVDSVIWPLFHYSPDKMSFDDSASQAYRQVNELFCEAIVPHVRDNDVIWIHDYHLMLLPGLLTEALQDRNGFRIGFFLHTPFPSTDFFSILPHRDAVLKSLLECDVVGFHIEEYVDHFVDACKDVL